VTLIMELLGRRGHRADIASDGRRTLELALRPDATYDLVLLDLHMPEKDGFEVVREIRAHERGTGKHLPIIALTARSSQRDRESALAAGMDDFLSKPIEVDALWAALDRVARKPGRVRPRRSSLLDPGVILRMCGGNALVLDKLCQVFQRTLPEQMGRARVALAERDPSRLREAVQMLTGTVAAFSTAAGDVASTLEDRIRAGDLASCTELVGRLDAMCAELVVDTRGLTIESLSR
jgi:CheY-like chemotaxis protein